MMSTLDIPASTFMFGVPLFLGAGFIFTSESARESSVSWMARFGSIRRLVTIRILLLVLLVSAFQIVLTIAGFIRFSGFSTVTELESYYLPGFMLTAVITVLLVIPIAVFLAVSLDDWRITTILGAGMFFAIEMMSGESVYPVRFSEVALLGIVQIHRALALLLGGVEFPSSTVLDNYVGFYFTALDLFIPLIVYSILVILSLWGTRHFVARNCARWKIDRTLLHNDSAIDPKTSEEYRKETKSLASRKKIIALLVVMMFLVLPNVSISYATYREESSEVVLYQTPDGGLLVEIGEWLYGPLEADRPPPGVSRMIQYRLYILDWGNCPDQMHFQHMILDVTLQEFETMMASGELDEIHSGSGVRKPETDFAHGWHGIPEAGYGSMVWGARFVDTDWNVTAGALRISLSVVLGDVWMPG
jgi:hypothetical protein